MTTLFEPIQIGKIHARNRIFMAPLTRGRASRDHIPSPLMAAYYAQRSGAGVIISEAIGISREGLGWPFAPGIWNQEQVEAWRPIIEAVHERKGVIFAQLWHMGRMVHSSVTGQQPVSCSATTAPEAIHTYDGKQQPEQARELTTADIARILNEYEHATQKALAAGFDGVQIHAANGYLIDEFLRDSTNHRSDAYGGSPENRSRFLREVAERVISVAGASRTAVRLSPNGDTQGCIDSNPERVFLPVARMLDQMSICFLELREPGINGTFGKTDQPRLSPLMREQFSGPLVLNQDYTREEAMSVVASGKADAVSFGRPFIANPDLPRCLEENLPWTKDEVATWYSRGEKGYTDYPQAGNERG